MERFKKLIAAATLFIMVASTAGLNAQPYYRTDTYGMGYEESRRSPSIAPAIALGTIAIVAIVAVAVQNRSHGHGSHSHSHNGSGSGSSN
jgi:hypothetical protein